MQKKKKRVPTSSFHLILEVDKNFQDFIINLSKKICKENISNFIVNNKNYKPHITLYLFSAPIKNIPLIIKKVEDLAKYLKPLNIKTDNLTLGGHGWIMLNVDGKKKILHIYHRKVVNIINKLREGVLRGKYRNKSYFNSLAADEKKSLLKYGDRHAFDLYNPHFSVAQIDDETRARDAYEKFRNIKIPEYLTVKSIELVRNIGDESGGLGKILFSKKL